MLRPLIIFAAAISSVSLMLAGAGLIQSAADSPDAILGLALSLTGCGVLTATVLFCLRGVRS